MDDPRPGKAKARNFTLLALFGLFVAAVVLAIAGRFVPGRLSRLARRTGKRP